MPTVFADRGGRPRVIAHGLARRVALEVLMPRMVPWAALGALLLYVALPWSTWYVVVPVGKTAAEIRNQAVTDTPQLLLMLGTMGWVAASVGRRDPWLGAFAGWTVLNTWRVPTGLALATVVAVTLLAWAMVEARRLRSEWWPIIRWGLVVSGLAQITYAAAQWFKWDPLWGALASSQPHGTLGNPNWFGAYLAIVTPLAPWPLLPVFIAGLLLANARLAFAAAAVGVAWRLRGTWARGGVLAAGLAMVALLSVVTRDASGVASAGYRWQIWGWAVGDVLTQTPMVGWGPGAWYWRVPAIQLARGNPMVELFEHAHNEVVQLLYEAGVISLVLVAGWLWAHRRPLFSGTPWAGAVAALAVTALGMFPFHVPPLAALGCVVLVGATRPMAVRKE
mgnify:CR=1 FL=1